MRGIFVAIAVVVSAALTAASPTFASAGPLYITTNTTLTEDHFGTILITSDNVTLDCAGHAVIGDGVGSGGTVGIDVSADDVTVTNCVVENFGSGIFTVAGVRDAHVVANTLVHNGEGVRLWGTTGAVVSGNSANENDFWGILACCNATGNTIKENTTSGNTFIGIALNDAPSNVVSNYVAAHNGAGLDVSFGSSSNTFKQNIARDNVRGGFAFTTGSNNNTIDHNAAVNNGAGGLGSGFSWFDSSGNTVTSNVAVHNGFQGFSVYWASELNFFTENHACENTYGDASDSSSGAGNIWTDNHFCNSDLG